MRCAITYVPPPDDPLTVAAAAWLGRDSYSGMPHRIEVEGLTAGDHSFLTALPRRSGFHATLKPPFVLEEGHSVRELERRLGQYATRLVPIALELTIAVIDTFFALVPVRPIASLDTMAANIVAEFDSYRRPMSPEDLERRSAARFTSTQLGNLAKWGSPFVFDQFRFHMTLTGPVDRAEREHVALVLARYFSGVSLAISVDRLVLAVQEEVHEPFGIHSAHPFARVPQLRIA
ncbi:MAG: DUF1045 domain-containing protein [Devosia sp.]|uniref:DUF1045 domain-containing protein n=1 Tax=Devosia sp. TaxID=1871048 RepID=UPI001A3E8CC9|nr:DUF1045 domain-containing protein [Devosia sp.]MBL8598633.1 DUF1045 domain-containing protein [Devosia sp.]